MHTCGFHFIIYDDQALCQSQWVIRSTKGRGISRFIRPIRRISVLLKGFGSLVGNVWTNLYGKIGIHYACDKGLGEGGHGFASTTKRYHVPPVCYVRGLTDPRVCLKPQAELLRKRVEHPQVEIQLKELYTLMEQQTRGRGQLWWR
ncbi:unnamed protein product [Prunus armeniaca]|uniref:Uncharacterized protein n=1 Tax=Prunus armeniaca TaxID=36596 RepID=A0A6J5UBT9_PRUAR|nr:unnamed protein product [Prunus armeniaca]